MMLLLPLQALAAPPSLEGDYLAKNPRSFFKKLSLREQVNDGESKASGVYTGRRANGSDEKGTWKLTIDGRGKNGYLSFASSSEKKGKTILLAIYDVGANQEKGHLATRTTTSRTWTVDPVQVYVSKPSETLQAQLAGRYLKEGGAGHPFKSLALTITAGKSTKPSKSKDYYKYQAVRIDGSRDSGVWSMTLDKKGDGYITLESHTANFAHGKRTLLLAAYQLGKGCALRTRTTLSKRWTVEPEQRYSKRGCEP
jgi:hypothetical protein